MIDHILETTDATFEKDVLERSKTAPVVVDFWAPWCGPCLALSPVLEELAREGEGRWTLAKINSDENTALAARFGVRGIPHVIAFMDGEPTEQFTGAQSKPAVEAFLKSVIPSPVAELTQQAMDADEQGDEDAGFYLWGQVLDHDPEMHVASVRRARILVRRGDFDIARLELAKIPEASDFRAEATNLGLLIDWAQRVHARGGIHEIRDRAAEDPTNVAHRFDFGCALALDNDFEGALAEFLEVVRADRKFEDDAGRLAMLALFVLLGDEHPLTREYRIQLSQVLY